MPEPAGARVWGEVDESTPLVVDSGEFSGLQPMRDRTAGPDLTLLAWALGANSNKPDVTVTYRRDVWGNKVKEVRYRRR
jgi:hypothetical protein